MKQLILFSALFVFFGCSSTNDPQELEQKPTNQIVLIFNKPIQNGSYTPPEGGPRYVTLNGDEIQFLDDNMVDQRLFLNIGAESDTVVIKTKRDIIELRLMYKGVDNLKYLFGNGDSVIFNYSGIKPIAEIINRQEDYEVTNFSLIERDSLSLNEYSAIAILRQPLIIRHQAIHLNRDEYSKFMEGVEPTALKNLPIELQRQYSLLEDLKSKSKISEMEFSYRLQNLFFDMKRIENNFRNRKKLNSEDLNALSLELNRLKERFPQAIIERDDSLFLNRSYNEYFEFGLARNFMRNVGSYSYNTGTSGGRITNYPQAYDSVSVAKGLTTLEKKKIQFENISKLFSDAGYFPIEKRWEYLNKFKNDYQDSAMVDFLVEKFNIKFAIDDDLELVDKTGKVTSLEALIASHKGKVLYIDYWASWCGPCINEMPSSKQLQKDLVNENIVYVYLSSDRTDRPWQKAMERLELNEGLHFRIDNAGYTTKMEELNIPSIPRYMIYDTKGKLVNNNAPRPSQSKVLKTELMKYIETSQ